MKLTKSALVELYLDKKLSTWGIERKYGISRGFVFKKLKDYGIKPRDSSQSHIKYPRKDFNGDFLEKSYMIGFAVGDLRVRKRGGDSKTINADCSSSKKAQIDLIDGLFSSYGKVWISKPGQRNIVAISAYLNESFNFLLTKRRTADRWILKNNKYFLSFLAGFIDSEGSFFISRGQGVFSLGNYNKILLLDIKNKLQSLGVNCGKLVNDGLRGYRGKDGYKRNKDYWHFNCQRKKHLLKLIELVKPYMRHGDKLKKAELIVENINFRNKLYGNIKMR